MEKINFTQPDQQAININGNIFITKNFIINKFMNPCEIQESKTKLVDFLA